MRVLQADPLRIRQGWLRPLARLVHGGLWRTCELAEALIRGFQQERWPFADSKYSRALTERSSEHIARMAPLYGLVHPSDPTALTPLCAVMMAQDRWPEGGEQNPMEWDDGLGYLGFWGLFYAHGDVLLPLLSSWQRQSSAGELLHQVVEQLGKRRDAEECDALQSFRAQSLRHGTASGMFWRDLGRPWLEPLIDFGLARHQESTGYMLTERGERLAACWRSGPVRVEEHLRGGLAADWVRALGRTPRPPSEPELRQVLADCPSLVQDSGSLKAARLSDLAMWAQVQWIREGGGVCLDEATLLALLGRPGFAASAGIQLASGLVGYETWVRWTGTPRWEPEASAGPVEALAEAPGLSEPGPGVEVVVSPPGLDTQTAETRPAPPPPVERVPVHYRALRLFVQRELQRPGVLALGGPALWLRQLGELLTEADAGLLKSWREDSAWKKVSSVDSPLVTGLVQFTELFAGRIEPQVCAMLDLLQRWRDTSVPKARVTVLLHEAEEGLETLHTLLQQEVARWLETPAREQRKIHEGWSRVAQITRWLLADAVLSGGGDRWALRGAPDRLWDTKLPIRPTRATARRWVAEQVLELAAVGHRGQALGRLLHELRVQHNNEQSALQVLEQDPPRILLQVSVHVEVSSHVQAWDQGVRQIERLKARVRHELVRHGHLGVWLRPADGDQGKLEVNLEDDPPVPPPAGPETKELEHEPQDRGEAVGFRRKIPPCAFPDEADPAREPILSALVSLDRARADLDRAPDPRMVTQLWVAVEQLTPTPESGGSRAVEGQQQVSELMARLALASAAGDTLRAALAALHPLALGVGPEQALGFIDRIAGQDVAERYRRGAGAALSTYTALHGTGAEWLDEDALVLLAELATEAGAVGEAQGAPERTQLAALAALVEVNDPLAAMELRSFAVSLKDQCALEKRLAQEHQQAAGVLLRAYRVRNVAVHSSYAGLGDDVGLYRELAEQLLPRLDEVVVAVQHPRCDRLDLPHRWQRVKERLGRLTQKRELSVAERCRRSAWGTDR